MGIGIDALEALSVLKSNGASFGHVTMLGRQHLSVAREELALRPALASRAEEILEAAADSDGYSEDYFRFMGANTVESLDYSDYEGCSLTHDLNQPIPESWHERADLVFDGGTLEHVFHFPNAIASAMNLVKVGGHYVSCTPCNNYPGHGFYQFSPELFFQLLSPKNGFQLVMMAVAEARWKGRRFRVENPEKLGHRITFPGKGPLQIIVIGKRISDEKALAYTPAQSDYAHTWRTTSKGDSENLTETTPKEGLTKTIKEFLRHRLPTSAMYIYDTKQISKRHKALSMRGVKKVECLSECLEITPKS